MENLSKIPNINQGGCGIVAVGLKRKHKKGTIVKLIAGFFQEFAHVVLKIDNKIYDANGMKDIYCLKGYNRIEEVSEEEMIKTIKNKKLWSDDFDRDNIDEISNTLGVNLDDLKPTS